MAQSASPVMPGGAAGPYSHISIPDFPSAPRYYFELRQFLENQPDRNQQSISQQRQNARDKLTRLSKLQFQELSTDVFDEMSRRSVNDPDSPFLPVRDDFHPKRNQARQKLATLPKHRFKDLAADVFFELEVRFPLLLEVSQRLEAQAENLSLPTNSNQNSPNHPGMPNYPGHDRSSKPVSINFNSLDALMADLGNLMVKDNSNSVTLEALRNEYDTKLSILTKTLRSMEEQLTVERDRNESLMKSNTQLEAALQNAREDYARLDQDLRTQQRLVSDAQKEADRMAMQLNDARAEHDELRRSADHDRALIRDLQSRIHTLESSNGNKNMVSPRHMGESNAYISAGDEVYGAFRDAIAELIRSSGSDNRTEVLVSMKKVVFACKTITEDVEAREADPNALSVEQREQLFTYKTQLTGSLTALMTAAKAHATGAGGPNSSRDIENATESLQTVMDMLSQLIGIRSPSTSSGDHPLNTQSLHAQGQRGSGYPTSPPGYRSSVDKLMNLESLRIFLETQTDAIVQAIQNLLVAMRTNSFDTQFVNTVNQIDRVVHQLDEQCRISFGQFSTDQSIRNSGLAILDRLLDSNTQLVRCAQDMSRDPAAKPSKQKLASASYEVAKFTKELVGLLES